MTIEIVQLISGQIDRLDKLGKIHHGRSDSDFFPFFLGLIEFNIALARQLGGLTDQEACELRYRLTRVC